MSFVKADLEKERKELDKLISENEDARRAYEKFQARIALQHQLVQLRKAEHMTQSDVANAAGISQQALTRIEKGASITISSFEEPSKKHPLHGRKSSSVTFPWRISRKS